MKITMFATMLFAGIVSSAYSAETAGEVKLFHAKGIRSVEIRTNSGLIHIEGTQASDIRVEQLPDNARACNVSMTVSGSQLILKATDKTGEYNNIKTGLRVSLPAGIAINAKTNSGNVEIQNINASIEARSNSGDIAMAEVTGSVKATSDSGDITGTLNPAGASKTIILKSTSGDISAVFPPNVVINPDVSTTSGKIHNDFSGQTGLHVTARTTSGDISLVRKPQ